MKKSNAVAVPVEPVVKKTRAVAVKPSAGSLEVPAYIKSGRRGLENSSQEDILIPRIKLTQKGTPDVESGEIAAGHFMNSITHEDYGTKITFIPLFLYKTRIWFDEMNKIICSSDDFLHPKAVVEDCGPTCAKCSQKDWNEKAKTTKDKIPNCAVFYNFPCVLDKHESEPMALSFSSTKLRTAKELITRSKLQNRDLFGSKYTLVPVEAQDAAGHGYFALKLDGAGFVSEKTYKTVEELYESMKTRNVSIDQSGAAKEE